MADTEIDHLDVLQEAQLKVLHLNTWHAGRAKGLETKMLEFIDRQNPDVILLQEVFEESLEGFGNALKGQLHFSQMCCLSLTEKEEEAKPWGVAIGSKHGLLDFKQDFYLGSRETSNNSMVNVLHKSQQFPASVLLQATVEVGSDRFNFGTTHFPWVLGGDPSDEQLEAFRNLERVLEETPDIVLTGDFNSPRGYPIFDSLSRRYKDNIPSDVTTTLDSGVKPTITWEYVIDGFFTSKHYLASNVSLIQGLSDHKGVMAEVQRTP